MTLHIFNPEHDIALASHLANFTAPHAGRQLRADLGFLPALWAAEGDAVLVENVEQARRARRKALLPLITMGDTKDNSHRYRAYLTSLRLISDVVVDAVEPWGWDKALWTWLKRHGVSESVLPSLAQIDDIRLLSHRRTAAWLLPQLRTEGTVGEAYECTTAEEVEALLARYGQVVMKAPWSSSGRGLRFLSTARTPFAQQAGWFRNLVASQGSVMVEPYYNKVKDFGMEFTALTDGTIRYDGLSIFHTVNGAYTGNVIATEAAKRKEMSDYLSLSLLDHIQDAICRLMPQRLAGHYVGPFGVDMMVVARPEGKGFWLHPCVEVNLRRTMGHVALALAPADDDVRHVMRVTYLNNTYKLKINKL